MDRTRPLVVCDPGHGGIDCGANSYLVESELNLDLALLFMLRAGCGFDVHLTRSKDCSVTLAERVAVSNALQADAFLSFHANACDDEDVRGFEVWTSRGQTAADALATRIFKALSDACPGMPGRADYDDGDPDREKDFYVLRHTTAPAVLIEFGFITNQGEAGYLDDVMNQLRIVEAVSGAVEAWLKERA